MSDTPLDEKLREILIPLAGGSRVVDPIAQIKQATGQHFYERFKAIVEPEMQKVMALPDDSGYLKQGIMMLHEAYMKVAADVSGINDKETN